MELLIIPMCGLYLYTLADLLFKRIIQQITTE